MLANAKQFVPPTNKTHSPRINAGKKKKHTEMVGGKKEK